MRIAVIDGVNQDIGLNILFPEADYYINNTEIDKREHFQKYNIVPKNDWSRINDKNYDYLFIIISLYDAKEGTRFFKQNIRDILNRELEIIDNNQFQKVFVFDNYDYDYDPNDIANHPKIDLFFKRNYNKTKEYKANVVPFPFIMFGEVSLIEKCDRERISIDEYFKSKMNCVFFTGTMFNHEDPQYGVFRNRQHLYSQIQDTVYNPGHISYNDFITIMRNSKFSLDLLGVGEPNKRTFEIVMSGSLMLSQKNDLKWSFEEEFCEETRFSNRDEYFSILSKLKNDDSLYLKCLERQYYISEKYFNTEWIKGYILRFLQDYTDQTGK